MIVTILDPDGSTVWPTPTDTPKGDRVIEPRGRLHHDRHPGRATPTGSVNPFWGKWAIYDGKTRPPGRLQDRHDQRQPRRRRLRLSSRRRPTRTPRRSPSASGWATATTRPNDGKLSLDTSAPLWSAILTEVSKGEPIAQFKPPARHRRPPRSTRSPGSSRARSRRKTINELFLPGTVPTQTDDLRVAVDGRRGERPAVAGRLRRPEGHRGLLQHVRGRGQLPRLAEGRHALGRPGGPRLRRRGGPKGTRTAYFYNGAVRPVRPDVGRAVRADQALCPIAPPPVDLRPVRPDPDPGCRPARPASRCRPRRPPGRSARRSRIRSRRRHDPTPAPEALELDDRRPVAALAALTGADRLDQRVVGGRRPHGVAQGAGAQAVDDQRPGRGRPARRRRGSARAPRAPRRPARRAGRATTRPTAPARAGAPRRWSSRHRLAAEPRPVRPPSPTRRRPPGRGRRRRP